MSTIIDSLVVTLGLDPSGYEKNRKQVNDDTKKLKEKFTELGKTSEQSTKKMDEGFQMVKSTVIGFLAILGAGIGLKEFLVGTMNSQAALGRMSQNLNTSAKDLRAWGLVATEMGDDSTASLGALQGVAGGLAEASIKGFSAFTQAARANGVVITEQMIKSQDYQAVLLAISKRMQELPAGPGHNQQALWLAGQLGVGSMGNELLLGPAELAKRLAEARSLAKGSSQEDVARAEVLQRAIAKLQFRFESIRNEVWDKLEPVLLRLGIRLATWLDKVDWTRVINQVEQFAKSVDKVVQKIGGWKVVAEILGAVLALKLLSPLLGVVIAVGRLTMLIGPAATLMGTLASSSVLAAGAFAALGVGIAAATGALAGYVFYKTALEGNAGGDWVGKQVATIASMLGSKKATEALIERNWESLAPVERTRQAKMYDQMLPANREALDKTSPAFGRLAHEWLRSQPASPPSQPPVGVPVPTPGVGSSPGAADPQHSRIFSSNAELFSSVEARTGLPPGVLARMYKQESDNGTQLHSAAGAVGPMQFMPRTGAQFGLNSTSIMDLDHSAVAAGQYLSKLLKEFHGDINLAVAAYNEGPGNVAKYGINNKETRDYVAKVAGSAAPTAQTSGHSSNVSHRTSSVETNIGAVNIHTSATDPDALAYTMAESLRRHTLIDQSDTVLN